MTEQDLILMYSPNCGKLGNKRCITIMENWRIKMKSIGGRK